MAHLINAERFGFSGPTLLTILPTYKCTAACPGCSLACSPRLRRRLALKEIEGYLEQAVKDFPSLRAACFTGGECFLLGSDLDAAIKKASALGLVTRCVTNGYWARSESAARRRVSRLVGAGLKEINFSTGSAHQIFVPFSTVVNGIIASAEAGLTTALAVEGGKQRHFDMKEMLLDERLEAFVRSNPARRRFSVLRELWVSDVVPTGQSSGGNEKGQSGEKAATVSSPGGCPSLFNSITINPTHSMLACCGLPMERIPELNLGDLRENSMRELYLDQFSDFLKLWLFLDGPEKVFHFANEYLAAPIQAEPGRHYCEFCSIIFHNQQVREVLAAQYQNKIDDVLFRLRLRRLVDSKLERLSSSFSALRGGRDEEAAIS